MDTKQALNILGLGPDPTPNQLKRAYRQQVRLWHPDRYSHGSALKPLAEKHLQEANLAYALLERRLPQAMPARSSGGSGVERSHAPRRRSLYLLNRRNGMRQTMAHLKRLLSKIEFSSVLRWLGSDVRTSFRPWYRYPDTAESALSQGAESASFNQILHNTLRRPNSLKRLHHPHPADGGDTVRPVSGVSEIPSADKK